MIPSHAEEEERIGRSLAGYLEYDFPTLFFERKVFPTFTMVMLRERSLQALQA
jgi:hypothetical protein